ncbi:MAG: phosphatidylglycerol lysyltransferase domain-containing protein [Candidatus Omnitrophica bacterium]|nr:phosphatidylglycerol lysyltransferase domain-containing protein [Candidatus Omnitrophota bacterium]
MNIQVYPGSAPLKLEDKEEFYRALADNPPLTSELTFTNLYCWREPYNFKVSRLDNLLVVLSDTDSGREFLNPIGSGDIKSCVIKILKDTKGEFIRIGEEPSGLFRGEGSIQVDYDRDNSDYLYAASDLIELKGRKYDGKRNLIRRFKAEHEYEYLNLDAFNIGECLEFEETWCTIRDCDSVQGLNNERQAIKEMIVNFRHFTLLAGAIRVGGRISAVAIAERLNPGTLVMHVLKADPSMPGLYQLIFNEFLMRQKRDFAYVNLEQDLGAAGLRRAKESYHPFKLINKYTLRLRNT